MAKKGITIIKELPVEVNLFDIKPSWENLKYPKEFVDTPEGKMPVEVYMQKHSVRYKIQYQETYEEIIRSAPPKFIAVTETVDFGFIFNNGIEIRGVGKRFWDGVGVPVGTDVIVKNVRPEVKMAPKLKEPVKHKKDERPDKK